MSENPPQAGRTDWLMVVLILGALPAAGWAAVFLHAFLSYDAVFAWTAVAASGGALALRLVQLGRTERQQIEKTVDFDKLRRLGALRYGPWLKENVRGQDAAIDAVLTRVDRSLKLSGHSRTLGAFLLVGPTGTGKTFLGKLIGEALFPQAPAVILRLNQYKQPTDVQTLLGPPPGMAGYEVGGSLTRPVLEKPHCVVILDELEKAHPDVLHCLYDILDTARCREKSSGRLVPFSGCVFIATCNAGVADLRALARKGLSYEQWCGKARDALAKAAGFESAFLARWDEILLMDELSPLHVAEVACLTLSRYWREQGLDVSYASPELIVSAVRRNSEYRDYGVRQLAHVLRVRCDDALLAAKTRGVTQVSLGLDAQGEIVVTEGRRA